MASQPSNDLPNAMMTRWLAYIRPAGNDEMCDDSFVVVRIATNADARGNIEMLKRPKFVKTSNLPNYVLKGPSPAWH